MNNSVNRKCLLILDDGSTFLGDGFGYNSDYFGEICFNTSITGYQEILTDPSYFKQIINFTFPHIGIVGTNKFDYESSEIYASACIINNNLTPPSNFRSERSFEDWLINHKKACVTNIDTRSITKSIRESGVCRALLHFPKGKLKDISVLKNELKKLPEMNNLDLAYEVSTKEIYLWKNGKRNKISSEKIGKEKFIACIDFGVKKKNIRFTRIDRASNSCIPMRLYIKKTV